MKLFKKVRKGFTLIELVVVIAVIAILSAVAVVSYVTITKKAKTSSDQQAVAQMNTILAANDVLELRSINDVFAAFQESEIDAKDYKPLVKDRYFFWDADANRIVYTDANYNVLYPEDMKGVSKNDHQWYSLTQSMKTVDIASAKEIDNTGANPSVEFTAASAEQLYTFGQELKDAMLSANSTTAQTTSSGYKVVKDGSCAYIVGDVEIVLNDDIDMMGSSFNFSVKGSFTIKGNGHTLKGVVNNKDFYVGSSKDAHGQSQPEKYGSGLVGYIAGTSTNKVNCVIENIKIENSVFGFSDTKGGGLVGYASHANVTFDRVSVSNCNMEAFEHSVGGFVGDTQSGVTINLKGANELKNCNLKLHEGTNADKECYGAGYFIGRQTQTDLAIVKADGASFTQSGNTKTYGSNNKINTTGGYSSNYRFWDNAESGSSY